ncbi:hypothetical protein HQ576_06835 [bacterium]|nr:hypothetical protein [bacterium]
MSCDLVCLANGVVAEAKQIIESETALPPSHVLICATHTHTGPDTRANGVVPVCEEWLEQLPRRIADAVATAAADMRPATLRVGASDAEGYAFNRLFRLKDGSEVFGKGGRGDQVVGPAGPTDPQLQTLSAVGEDGQLLALLVNYALHVDVIGGGGADFVSADWPGEMARNIAAVYGDQAVTLLLQGTAGDINHHPHDPTHLPAGGPAKAVQLGRALGGAAMVAMERAEPMEALPLAAALQIVPIPYYTRDAALLAETAALKAKDSPSDFERYLIQRTESWPHDGQDADVPVQTMRIGRVGLVGLPAEIFVKIGFAIKDFAPSEATFVVELANGRASTYVPTTDQAERGAYGAKPILSRWLCADAGRRMADAAHVMLHQMF